MKNKTKGLYNPRTKKDNSQVYYAGLHLILEFWQARNINSVKQVKKALTDSVKACQARLLEVYVHKFSPQGVSGVAIIAESHISIHTWPEYQYAAFDIFMCGDKDPYQAVKVLKKYFQPKKVEIKEIKRGIRRQ